MEKSVKGSTKPVYKGINYTGKTVGNWTVLDYDSCIIKGKKYYTKWLCQCSCGAISKVYKANLLSGKSNGCSKCASDRASGSGNPNWTGTGDISGSVWYRVLYGAKSRGISVDVTEDLLQRLWDTQDGRCALSALDISLGSTASLDRVDSSVGYCEGNLQWVHKDVNRMKNAFEQGYFIEVCRKITERNNLY